MMDACFVGGETWVGDGEGKRAEAARSDRREGGRAGAAGKAQLSTHGGRKRDRM